MAKVEQRNCLKSPHKYRTSILSSAENGSTGLYLGVSRFRRPTIEASPTTFRTVSLRRCVNRARAREGEATTMGRLPSHGRSFSLQRCNGLSPFLAVPL